MTKLTQEQKDELSDLIGSSTWEAVLTLCKMSVENHEIRMRTIDIAKSDRDLVLAKARLEGALDMQRTFHSVREYVGGAKKEKK